MNTDLVISIPAAIAWVCGAMVAGVIIGGVTFSYTTDVYWKSDAIKSGVGLYCADTGYFAWKGKCK